MNIHPRTLYASFLLTLCGCEKEAPTPPPNPQVTVPRSMAQPPVEVVRANSTVADLADQINRLEDPIAKVVEVKKQLQVLASVDTAKAAELANRAQEWTAPDVIALSLQRACKFPGVDFDTEFTPYLTAILKSNLATSLKGELISRYVMASAGSGSDMEKIIGLSESLHAMSPERLAQIYQDFATTDPVRAVSVLNGKKWSADLQKATVVAHAQFAMEDATQASEQVKALKGRENYDWAVAGLYQVIRSSDPESAKVWRAEIQKPEAQLAADAIRYSIQIKR